MDCHACGVARRGTPGTCGGCGVVLSASGGDRGRGDQPGTAESASGPAGSATSRRGGSGDGDGDGGRDITATFEALPWVPAILGGLAIGILFVLVGVVVAVFVPERAGQFAVIDIAAITAVDLHFGFPTNLVPHFVFQRFDVFAPAPSLLGLLYVLPPLFLYTIGKFVTAQSDAKGWPIDAAVSGAAIVVGYLPVIVVAVLLVPDLGPLGGGILTPIFLGGIVYPVVFGALGGLAEGYYTDNQRRIGVAYGVGLFVVLVIVLMLGSFLSVSLPGAASLPLIDRLFITAFVLTGVQTLSGVGTIVGAGFPVLLAAVVAFGFGYLRVWRTADRLTPLEGAVRPLTSAWTYLVLVGAVVTLLPVLADGYAADELAISFIANNAAEAIVQTHLSSIGDYLVVLVVGTILFPVLLSGAGGAAAAWYEQQTAYPTGPPS